jgi:DNA-binding transcriptional LysR family regulator
MRDTTLDLDALRSFATGVSLGSFARAAERLNRSTSAVSAQLKKLEQQAGVPLLSRQGRGLTLTPAGETLLGYARRLLALNDEAVEALAGPRWQGQVRLGLQAEFGEQLLPGVLGRFARAHPRLQVEAQIARSAALHEGLSAGRFDLVLAWSNDTAAATAQTDSHVLADVPMCWIAGPQPAWQPGETAPPVPLAMLDAPCPLRTAAIEALDRAGISWRITFSSASLAGVWAAIEAGLGIGLRTPLCLPPGLHPLQPANAGLPTLASIKLQLHQTSNAPVIVHLAELIRQAVDERLADSALGQVPTAA